MSIKLRLAAAVAFALCAQSAGAAPCRLDAADFESLRLSPSHLSNQKQVDALPKSRLPLLCETRNFWHRVRANRGAIPDADWNNNASPYYSSPAESKLRNALLDAHLDAILKKMPQAQWRKVKQRLLDEAKVKAK